MYRAPHSARRAPTTIKSGEHSRLQGTRLHLVVLNPRQITSDTRTSLHTTLGRGYLDLTPRDPKPCTSTNKGVKVRFMRHLLVFIVLEHTSTAYTYVLYTNFILE